MRNLLCYLLLSLLIFACSDDNTPKESIPQDSSSITLDNIDSTSRQKTLLDSSNTKIELKRNKSFKNLSYDDKNERIVDHSIFTDGNTFVVQESAWKKEEKAIRQASKLREDGHETFVTTIIFEDGQIWYRVRIGYFDTITEAIRFKKQLLNE